MAPEIKKTWFCYLKCRRLFFSASPGLSGVFSPSRLNPQLFPCYSNLNTVSLWVSDRCFHVFRFAFGSNECTFLPSLVWRRPLQGAPDAPRVEIPFFSLFLRRGEGSLSWELTAFWFPHVWRAWARWVSINKPSRGGGHASKRPLDLDCSDPLFTDENLTFLGRILVCCYVCVGVKETLLVWSVWHFDSDAESSGGGRSATGLQLKALVLNWWVRGLTFNTFIH